YGDVLRLPRGPSLAVGRRRDLELVQQRGETASILSEVDRLRGRPEDRDPFITERPSELERRLTAELRDHPHRPLGATNGQNVLCRQGFEVEAAGRVVIRRDGLGVR